nr:ribonuclease H-like domain-containing protein [Tanacetum cinerariifolium]
SFMPPKPDMVFVDDHVVSESVTSLPGIAKIEVKTSELKPKTVSAPIIEDWGNPQQELQEKGVIDSGCSRHMTGNMSYLSEYEVIDGGYVAFGGDPKGGKITCKVLTDTAAFEEVCLAVLSILRPELVKIAFGTKFPF